MPKELRLIRQTTFSAVALALALALAGCGGRGTEALPSTQLRLPSAVTPASLLPASPRRDGVTSSTPARPLGQSSLFRASSAAHPGFFAGESYLGSGAYYLAFTNTFF